MYSDKIIAEVWRNRDAYAAEHGHDLARIVADLQRRQNSRRGRVVDGKRSEPVERRHSARAGQQGQRPQRMAL